MNGRIVVDCVTRSVVEAVVAFGFVAAAPADPGPSAHSVTITVFADRYIVGNLAFDDLDLLEKHITATYAHEINLLICGAKATRALKAAVHRFRHVAMRMRMHDVDELECVSMGPLVTPIRQRVGQRPFGIDDEAVERFWLDLMR